MARRYTDYFFDSDPPAKPAEQPADFTPTSEVEIKFNPSITDKEKNRQLFDQVLQGEGMNQDQLFEHIKSNPDSARKIVGKYAPRDNEQNFESNRYSKELITALDQGNFDEIRRLYQPTEAAPAPEAPAANVPQQPAETQPETTTTEQPAESLIPGAPKYKTVEQIREEYSKGYSPMKSLLQSQNPVLDAKRQERLQRIAAINSVGKGLGTILQGYYGKKGATITPDKNELLPEAYKEYMSNIDEYEKKKDIWNKDMLALSLKEQGDVDAAVKQQENNQRADAIAAWQQNNQKLRDEATMKFQKEMNSINQEFQERMAKARSADELKMLQMNIAARQKEAEDNFKRQMSLLEEQIKGGKYGGGARSSLGVERIPGTENNPLAFRSASGKQIFLNPDQLDVVPDIIQRELLSMDKGAVMYRKMYEKMFADGKITELEARAILSRHGEKYFDFVNGKAVPKGQAAAQPAQQTISTGGAY